MTRKKITIKSLDEPILNTDPEPVLIGDDGTLSPSAKKMEGREIAVWVMMIILAIAVFALLGRTDQAFLDLERVHRDIAALKGAPEEVVRLKTEMEAVRNDLAQINGDFAKAKDSVGGLVVGMHTLSAQHERDILRIFGILGKPRERGRD